jgi:hypothetical protein
MAMCCSPGVEEDGRMLIEIHNDKKPNESALEMDVAALEGNPNPLDMDMSSVNPDPTSLDMPEEKYQEMCSNPRCSRPAVDECIVCGHPLCEDSVA